MYVCICQGITEEQILQVTKNASNVSEALKKLGVGQSCGICLIDALSKAGLSPHSSLASNQNETKAGQKSVNSIGR